jgi:hypothetical protein
MPLAPTRSPAGRSILLVLVAALALAGCSSGNASPDGRLSPVDVVIRGCEATCNNADVRYACVEGACTTAYTKCFGAGYRSGDYTGGVCKEGLECLARSAVACQADCSPTPTCFDCVVEDLVTCAEGSGCPSADCPD